MTINCADAREGISARMDGEDPGRTAAVLDEHLRGCETCRTWSAKARIPLLDRAAPDLIPGVLAAVKAAAASGPDPVPRAPAPPGSGQARNGASAAPTPIGLPGRRPRLRTAAIAASVVVVAAGIGVGAAKLVRGNSSAPLVSTQQVTGSTQTDSRYPGATVLPTGVPKPTLVLTDTSGHPYDLTARTAGRVTLVYFGYTHCPDVCPINMALAAQALQRMPAAEARLVDVVFVSTDPARDTPPVIRSWLDNFNPSFVGLTGSIGSVEQAETLVGMAKSFTSPGGPAADGGYQVVHSGYTLVYTQDDTSHLQFFDTAHPEQYATTLEHLVTRGFQA